MIGSLLHVVPLIFVCPYCVQEVLPILIFGKTNMEQLVSYVSCFFLHNFCIEAINDYAIFDTDLQKVKKISKPSGIIKKISTCMAMLVISTSI